MKKTQRIDLRTTIRKSLVSYLSVVIFVALGIALYAGLSWTCTYTDLSIDQQFRDCRYENLQITYPYGISEEQMGDIKNVDGVDDAEGFNSVYRFFLKDGERQQAVISTLTERISAPMNIEGTLPSAENEIAVIRSYAEKNGISIGDTVTFMDEYGSDYRQQYMVRSIAEWDPDSDFFPDTEAEDPGYLKTNTFTVTAIVDSPDYLMQLPVAYGINSINGISVDAVMFVSEKAMDPELFGGYTGVAVYSEALSQMSSGSEYDAACDELKEKIQAVTDTWTEVPDGYAATVESLGEKLDEAESQLQEQEEAIEKKQAELDAAKAQLGGTNEQIAAGEKQLEEARSELEEKQLEYESELESYRQMADAQEDVDLVEAAFTTRADNISLVSENEIRDIVANVRSILAIVFLVVAILVGESTLSRMVEDQVRLIGTKKALGFKNREIRETFLLYAATAVSLGALAGTAGACGVELVFTKNFSSSFLLADLPLKVRFVEVLVPFAAELILMLAAVFAAAQKETRRKTIDLLNNNADSGSRQVRLQRFPLFRRMSLLNQIIITNFVKDKKRVFGMLIGVVGSSLLITAGLTYWLNIEQSFRSEYTDYFHFDTVVDFDSSSETAASEIQEILDRYGVPYAEVYYTCMFTKDPDGVMKMAYTFVPVNAEDISNVMEFYTDDGEKLEFSEGFWMSGFMSKKVGSREGDTFLLQTMDGTSREVKVTGFFNSYQSRLVAVMSRETYEAAFSELKSNAFAVNLDSVDSAALQEELNGVDGYICEVPFREDAESEFSSSEMVFTMTAGMFVLMAVLLAVMVLFNLMDVYISEKKRELITLMINGYPRSYAKRYIWMDTVILTIAGIVIGDILGSILGMYTQNILEGETMYLRHGVSWISCAAAALITGVIALIITLIELRKIDRFHLSDINN